MTYVIDEKYSKITDNIMANLPTSQFVVDLVGEAISAATSKFDEEEAIVRLAVAHRMSQYAKETSQPLYFKTHLVIAPLIAGLEVSEIERFFTASGVLQKAIGPLGTFVTAPTFKQKWKAIFELSSIDIDLMAAAFMFAKADVEKAVAEDDKYKIAGYGYLEVNMRQANIFINHTVRKFYNEFATIVLNKAEY